MFFCDPCGKERGWPQSLAVSYGKCEICDKTGRCNDIPSSKLPPSRKEPILEALNHCPSCVCTVSRPADWM